MEFRIKKVAEYYDVYFSGKNMDFDSDSQMARLLSLEYKEYIDLKTSYGAERYTTYLFDMLPEAIEFMQFLNDTYLVALKLQEKI